MASILELSAEKRATAGKGAARAIRRQGLVPAVIYGDKKDPEPISLESPVLIRHLESGRFLATLYEIEVDGTKTRVIPRDVQFDPVRDFPMHVDFLRLGKGARIDVEIAMTFINEEESPGLERGGVLNVVRYTVELSCPADNIPEELIGDLTGLDIGDSIHISDIDLPEGVTPTIADRDFTVATVAAPAAMPSDEEEEEEGEEGEEIEGEEGEEGAEGEDGDEASSDDGDGGSDD